jgi:two-component system, OmpR family, sensor histidine kinase ChvG
MSDLPSNAFETNSAVSTLDFPKSKTTQRSDTAGAALAGKFVGVLRFFHPVFASLTAKLIILVGIFIALPILVYGQFEQADAKLRELVTRSIQHRNWLIAQALKPILDQPGGLPSGQLSQALTKYGDDGTNLQLMVRPSAPGSANRFYFVAAAPPLAPDQVNEQLDSLASHGILDRLGKTCISDVPIDVQYPGPDGKDEILTSLVPIQTKLGCWALVSSHTTSEFLYTSIARPFWKTPEVRIAASVYVLLALLAALIATSVWRNVLHFRHVARDIRQGRGRNATFASRNVMPELASVARDFDGLTRDLRTVARDIRQAAEDNWHSFKGPVATIEASLETAKRGVSPGDERANRAITLMQSSVRRLKALISAAQRLDNATADLIEAPRPRIDLTNVVASVLVRYRELMAERGIGVVRTLQERAFINAGQEILEEVIENILDNAISFSPPNATITVALNKSAQSVELRIDDEGPGIDPKIIDRIFDRYYSLRPSPDQERGGKNSGPLPHAGLGLWIVRRNIEALGGTVAATNRSPSGLSIRVLLPAS